jgi:UPF0176 protein
MTPEHLSFYQLVPIAEPDKMALHLRALTTALYGSIIVSYEGINGVVSGLPDKLNVFERTIKQDATFAHMLCKRSYCHTEPFGRMKVQVKKETVCVGLGVELQIHAAVSMSTMVSPLRWRELIKQSNVLVLDNRNHFEFRLGHFNAALNPEVKHFRDFPRYIMAHAEQWRDERKIIAMYCTGGIRCEKTSAWMQHTLGLEVRQLEGGVLHYFQTVPDAHQDWQGECFVFDKRIAINTRLQPASTTAEQVYVSELDGAWRLQRAQRLSQC